MNLFRRKPSGNGKNGNGADPNEAYSSENSSSAELENHFALLENGGVDKAFAIAGAPPIAATGSAPTRTPLTPAAPAASAPMPVAAPAPAATADGEPVTSEAVPLPKAPHAAEPISGAPVTSPKPKTPAAAEKVKPQPSRLSPELARAAALRINGNSTSKPVIRVRGLKKIYQMGDVEVRALQGVDIDIYPGEITAIMGPSGSGKSTLMNIIGCLDVPTEGTYTLDGSDVSRMNDDQLAEIRCHKIGFVFQSFNLLSRTTAQANVELPLIYSGVGAGERHKRAKAALELVGLGERLDHKPNELSGGQQQRVAIARALINQPAMILADEPTGNLDSKTSVEIMELFQRLNIEQGITIVFVTHNTETADYCHRTIRVRDGLVEVDRRHRPLSGIYNDPAVVALAGGSVDGASVRQYVSTSAEGSVAEAPITDAPTTDAPMHQTTGTPTGGPA